MRLTKKKKVYLIIVISLIFLFVFIIAATWGWFYVKGFSVRNAPIAMLGLINNKHEVLSFLISKSIKEGSDMRYLPDVADSVWIFGDYSKYNYYIGDVKKYHITVQVVCRSGKVISAQAIHPNWDVVFFETDREGEQKAWEQEYGDKD